MREDTVVTRFAPSPTGFMHIGGVRTALFAWAYARKYNGKFILRIEDTDKAREVPGSIEHIIESLKWLGITWDEGPDIGGEHTPYIQSQRLDTYKKYADILIEKGFAYTDPYSEQEVEGFRQKSIEEGKPFLFREYRPENPPAWDGTKPLRFKVPEVKSYEWTDLARGVLSAGPEALDDFILIKSDGYPTYNFAHIIDDLYMNVTHIMRSDEFISSIPKFLSLYEALEIKRPEFVTLPPIMAPDGKKKLGKRDGAKDVLDYRNEGYLPEAMINFLVFIGWNPGDDTEIITPDEFVQKFDISKIHKSGGKFNIDKLNWINREYIKKLDSKSFWTYAEPFTPKWLLDSNSEIVFQMEPLLRDRIEKFSDIQTIFDNGEFNFFFKQPEFPKENAVWKDTGTQKTGEYMSEIIAVLEPLSSWTSEDIKNAIWPLTEKNGRGQILWPLRYSLSGLDKSPDPFTIAAILGKTETIERLKKLWI